jgi:hypothetical protein
MKSAADVSESRRTAIARAKRIRSARAGLKRAVAAGHTAAATIISESPSELGTMPVEQIVSSQPWWGPVRSRRLLRLAFVPEGQDLRSLTQWQRDTLVSMLDARCNGPPSS